MTNDELKDHLAAIRAEAGALTPDAVVAAATEEDHPLHSSFTWDDTAAAHAHRISQARHLIRRVRIIVPRQTPSGVREIAVRGLASVVDREVRQYVPVEEVMGDEQLIDQVMKQIAAELAVLRSKYRAYGDLFARAVEAMDAA